MNVQAILDKYHIDTHISFLHDRWKEPHRVYHDISHLEDLLEQINKAHESKEIDEKQMEKLVLIAYFHDIVYEPLQNNNEELSAAYFEDACRDCTNKEIIQIKEAILATKTHEDVSEISAIFNRMDMDIVTRGYDEMLEWEKGIYEEFDFYGPSNYKAKRLERLNPLPEKYPENKENLEKLIQWVKENY